MNFYGKYRGKVNNNDDPKKLGRLQVSVPSILENGWAMPCVPYAGPGVGLLLLPPNDANVWVEFEGGNPDKPIWVGCYWNAEEEMPVKPTTPAIKALRTDNLMLCLDDMRREITLTVLPASSEEKPVTITVNQQGIVLASDPAVLKLAMMGITLSLSEQTIQISPSSVSINNGALEVMGL